MDINWLQRAAMALMSVLPLVAWVAGAPLWIVALGALCIPAAAWALRP